MHAAGGVALGHLLMDNAAAGGHPLHIASGNGAAVAHAVAVFDGTGEDIGDGLNAAMGMPRKAGKIILGHIVAKIGIAKAESAPQMDACALQGGLRLDDPLYRANGHRYLRL